MSSRPDNFASKLCRKHRIANLREAASVRLLPAFVDLDVLERETSRVLRADVFDRDAERRVRQEGPVHDERVRRARVADEALRLRADDLAEVIEPNIDPQARHELASRSVRILTGAPVDIVSFELDRDLDLYTDLVFASDVTMAAFGDIRIYRGAALVFDSPSFVLRAASAKGNLVAVTGETAAGINLHDHILQV
ncbi:MAG: hypothetical protein ACRDTF_03150 [Pseudonocardiaceae bacterium]